MGRTSWSIGKWISSIRSHRLKWALLILATIGIIGSNGATIYLITSGVDYNELSMVLGMGITKAIIFMGITALIVKLFTITCKLEKKPDLILNYLITFMPYLIICIIQFFLFLSLLDVDMKTSGTIPSSISMLGIIKLVGIPVIVGLLKLSIIVAQYSLNRDYLELRRGKSILLSTLLAMPIVTI